MAGRPEMSMVAGQEAFAAALLDPGLPVPSGVTSARGHADAARFAVYRNNVFVGLTRALAKRFPVTARLVGEEFFTGMARVYAGIEKPASPLLFRYGDSFPDFIEAFEPARVLPYLADVARIEVAWTRAYHAADAAPLEISAVAAVDPELLPRLRLAPHASALLVVSRQPVGSIWGAHQSDKAASVTMSGSETVLVSRPALDVRVTIIPPADAAFAERLFGGASLGEAAQAAANHPSFDFGRALVGLLSVGAFAAIEHSGPKGNQT